MSFFAGVTLSVAGLVVLAFAIMQSEIGEILVGRHLWNWVKPLAALIIVGTAVWRPDDYTKGIDTVMVTATAEANEVIQPIVRGMFSIFTPTPTTVTPPEGIPR